MRREADTTTVLTLDLLDRAAAATRGALEDVLLPHELSLEAWRVLQVLCQDGAQSMGALGEAAHTTGPTLTRIVDRLVSRSLVYRNVDPGDRRRLLVHPADRGRDLHDRLLPPLREAEAAALAGLSGEEAATLRGLLERLA